MFKLVDNRKGKSSNGWLIIAIIAAAFLIPQSPFYLGSIFAGETAVTWQGLEWAYSGYKAPSFGELEASQSFSCSSSCSAKLRSDFNTADYDEIRVNYEASTSAYAGTSASGSGSFDIAFGGVGLASVSSGAEERGGTNIPSDADTGSETVVLKKTSSGWDVVKDEITIKRIAVISPVLEFFNSANGNYGGGMTSSTIRVKVKSIAAESCKSTGGNYSFSASSCACPSGSLGFDSVKGCIADTSCKVGEVKQADGTCKVSCKTDEVELISGSCKKLTRTCIDNNLNSLCDPDDPVVFQDPDSLAPVCADRNNDRICDDVASLFCKDENNNRLCDSDEMKWYATNCPDINKNNICDGVESGQVLCPATYTPVCDERYNITYPNSCFAGGFNATTTEGACKVPPVIIRLDCTTGQFPIPSGYLCQPETGFLYKIDKIYQNVTIDCRILPATEGYTCQQIGDTWVFTKTEVKNIDCYSRGCPTDSLCQGGLCVQNQQKCPTQVNCALKYGSEAACDEETGLCVKQQYFNQDCTVLGCSVGSKCTKQADNSNVCVKTEPINATTVFDKNPVFGKPRSISTTALIIFGAVIFGAIVLAARKKQ